MTPDFGRMVVYKWNKYINEDPNNFGRMVVLKVIINGRAPRVLIKWLRAYKKIKFVPKSWLNARAQKNNNYKKATYFGRMVVCIWKK